MRLAVAAALMGGAFLAALGLSLINRLRPRFDRFLAPRASEGATTLTAERAKQ